MKGYLKGPLLEGSALLVLLFLSNNVGPVEASDSGPQIDLGIKVIDDVMGGTDNKATYIVYTHNFGDETGSYELTLMGLPSGWTYSLNPDKFDLAPKTQKQSTLVIYAPECTHGDYYYTVFGKETKSGRTDSESVIVYASPHVPEFPLGGAMEIALMLAVVFVLLKKRRKIL